MGVDTAKANKVAILFHATSKGGSNTVDIISPPIDKRSLAHTVTARGTSDKVTANRARLANNANHLGKIRAGRKELNVHVNPLSKRSHKRQKRHCEIQSCGCVQLPRLPNDSPESGS